MISNQTSKLLNLLFNEKDTIAHGSLYRQKLENFPSHESEFFSINSIHPMIDFGYKIAQQKAISNHKDASVYGEFKPRKADCNVTSYRNFLFEMDAVNLSDQMQILTFSGIPFSSIVYSGGKSYHAILSLEEPLDGAGTKEGLARYKHVWSRLAAEINQTAKDLKFTQDVVDPSCKNPSRLSRFPEYVRKTGNKQHIISITERISSSAFNVLINQCPVIKQADEVEKIAIANGAENELQWFGLASEGLKNKLKYVDWGATDGLYPIIYKLTLWSWDETAADKQTFLNIFHKYTVPQLLQAGYPEHKLEIAINDAYNSITQ